MGKRVFGELELAILNVFRKDSHVRTVRDCLQALGKKDKYTTIMTVMNRLVTKGELERKREGQSYVYAIRTRIPKSSLFEKWKQKIFGGNSALMIRYLLETAEGVTQRELAEIEELLHQAKKGGK